MEKKPKKKFKMLWKTFSWTLQFRLTRWTSKTWRVHKPDLASLHNLTRLHAMTNFLGVTAPLWCERVVACIAMNLKRGWISQLGSSRRVLVYSIHRRFQQLGFSNNFVIAVRTRQRRERFAWGIDTSRWQTMMSVMMMTALLCRHILTVNFQTVQAFFVLFRFVSLQETDRTLFSERKKQPYACGMCEWVGLFHSPCRPDAILQPPPTPPPDLEFCSVIQHFIQSETHHKQLFRLEGKTCGSPSASSVNGRRCCHLVPLSYGFV